MSETHAARAAILRGLIMAGLILGVAIALRLLSPDYVSRDLRLRVMGVLMGVTLVVFANAVPKSLTPLTRIRCNPASEQALRRFTGWSLTLGGSAYVVSWLVAPLDRAPIIATSLLGASLLAVIVRLSWATARRLRA
jgi:hypothetical protein